MKKFNGTKGKWEIKHSESKTAYNVIGTDLGGKYKIARCPYIKSPIKADEYEAKANAQLIATAPELLEALINFVDKMDCNIYPSLSDEIKGAEKIINKALGIK